MNSNYQTIVGVLGGTAFNVEVTDEMKRSTGNVIRLLCDTKGGAITINLPKIANLGNFIDVRVLVDDIADNATANNITIVCDVANKIENAVNYVIQINGGKAELYVSNKLEWGVMALETTPATGVKVFKAIVSQAGVAAPAFGTVLVNDLGEVPTFSYHGVGEYTLTVVAALFTVKKTSVILGSARGTSGMADVSPVDNKNFAIKTYSTAGVAANACLTVTTILIEIYP